MLKIRACATLHQTLGDVPTDLRARLKQLTGQDFRRINRFIELSLLGAFSLRERAGDIAADAAVYIACTAPMLTDSVRLVQGIVRDRRPPSPFEFLNISGNMAGFYVAQHLGLSGPQLALHRTEAPFKAALELLALQSAHHRRALLGYVEEGLWPLAEQRQRLRDCGSEQPVAECSHWLHVDQDCEQAIAVIEVGQGDADALRRTFPFVDDNLWLAAGLDIAADSSLSKLSPAGCFDAGANGSYSSDPAAMSVCRFIEQRPAERLLHLGRADNGEYHAISVRLVRLP